MKTILVPFFSLLSFCVHAQNIGIGSPNPQKKLTVNGSVLLDENNTNDGGIDSAALLFGTSGNVGIASKKTSAGWQNGLSFFTNSQPRMTIAPNGFIGMNNINPTSLLHVNGSMRSSSDIWAGGLGRFDGRLAIGGAGLPEYKLHNNGNSFLGGNVNVTGATALTGTLNVTGFTTIDDNARINGNIGIGGPASGFYGLHVQKPQAGFDGNITVGETAFLGNLQVENDGIINGNARVNGRIGINGPTNGSYGLMVNNANSYFEGNATVQGNTNLQGNVTIQGNGHVRSNGNSSLRIGFETVSVQGGWNSKQERNFTINLPDFGTNIENIRVSVAQFDPEDWVTTTSDFKWYIYNVNHLNGTAQLRVINESNGIREFFGIFYILIVVKDI